MAAREGFREFFARQAGPLRALGYRLTGDWGQADDLAQEALLRTYRSWDRIKERDRPELYARAVLINHHRSLLRRVVLEAKHLVRGPSEPSVVHGFDAEAEAIRAEVRKLPARQRAALVLYFYEDMPQGEIASVLGCPIGTVQSLVHRGIERLRKRLTAELSATRSEA